MSSDLIRVAQVQDLQLLRQIEVECVGNSAVPMGQLQWLLEGQGEDPAFSVRVSMDAADRGVLTGFICWKKKLSLDALYFEILNLSVGKNYRDERIEHELVAEVVREAALSKCLGVSVNVPHSNLAAASFYLGLGFQIQHTVKKYYSDGTDMDVMVKRVL